MWIFAPKWHLPMSGNRFGCYNGLVRPLLWRINFLWLKWEMLWLRWWPPYNPWQVVQIPAPLLQGGINSGTLCATEIPWNQAEANFHLDRSLFNFYFHALSCLPQTPSTESTLNNSLAHESVSEVLLLQNLTYNITNPAFWFSVCKLHVKVPRMP